MTAKMDSKWLSLATVSILGQTPGLSMLYDMVTRAAVTQKPPVLLNQAERIERTVTSTDETVSEGTSLYVFPGAHRFQIP